MNEKDFEIYNYQILKNQKFFHEEHFGHFLSNESIVRIPKPKKFKNFRENRQKKESKRNLAI